MDLCEKSNVSVTYILYKKTPCIHVICETGLTYSGTL